MDRIIIITTLVLFMASCKKTEPYTSDLGTSYFPIQEGHFIEYKVLEIFHDADLIPATDTTAYYLKVLVGEKIVDNTGDSVNKFFYFKKTNIDSNYVLDKVNTLYNNGYQAIYNLDNQKYVKLVFPATLNSVWNVNSYITAPALNSRIIQKDYPGSIETFSFPSLLKTQQLNFFSLVDYQKAYEVYAKDVGLVKIYFKDLTIQNFDTLDIQKGQEIYYDLISYGIE